MAAVPPWRLPFWIAHRGAGKLAPENTLAAFCVGANHGYRAFECDVKLSSDGVPFLLHDATLERSTSGRGRAADLPWSELARLDAGSWHSPRFAGELLPSFEAVAAFCQDSGYALNVEIKPTPGSEAETGRVVAAQAQRLWQGKTTPLLFSSFQVAALATAAATAPEIARALLLDEVRVGWHESASALGCAAVVFRHSLIDAPVLTLCKAGRWMVMAYTVNDVATATRLGQLGVDGLITDAVDRFPPASGAPAP